MTIRAKLTLWYAGVIFFTALLVGVFAYAELVVEKRAQRRAPRGAVASPRATAPLPPAGPAGDLDATEEEETSDLVQIALWCGAPAALLGLAGGWILMRRVLAPVVSLTEAARRLNERTLAERLPYSGNGDELDRLTQVFNDMLGRLEQSFQRIREFSLHASHELKTPLTILHGQLETALQNEALAPAHRELLASQFDEVQRLAAIVDGLSFLTKADNGQVTLARQTVFLDELVRDAFADAMVLARPLAVAVTLAECESLAVTGDRHRLRQLLLNLTDNAIKYNQPQGRVTLALRRTGEGAQIMITNTGPGVPLELQPRVFDRFFRGDSSHGHAVEGCGLGLSIAQWIVHAHAGTIRFVSEPAKLTTVTVQLPCASAAA